MKKYEQHVRSATRKSGHENNILSTTRRPPQGGGQSRVRVLLGELRASVESLAESFPITSSLVLRTRWMLAKWRLRYSDVDYAQRLATRRGRTLNVEDPVTYNDKLWFLKLSNRDPLLTRCTDKHAAREYVAEAGLAHILKTEYAYFTDVAAIDFDLLPSPSYLKCSHGSGLNWVYRSDASNKEKRLWLRRFAFLLKQNHYWLSREWNYKNITPGIVCEEYFESEPGRPIPELQFFCFFGEPRFVGYNVGLDDERGRKLGGQSWFFDVDFRLLPLTSNNPTTAPPPPRPEGFEQMLEYARRLAAPFPHVRVDLFNLDGRIYFNELTFYPFGGFVVLEPEEWLTTVGAWLDVTGYSIADDAKRGGIRRALESFGISLAERKVTE